MNRIFLAIGGAIVGGLIVFLYNTVVAPKPPSLPTAGPCSGGNPHCIVVTVITVNGKPLIQQIPDEKVKNGAAIFWEIATPGYTFPANGIDFPANKPVDPAPVGQFTCSPMGSTTFKCIDAGDKQGTFGYIVTLQGSEQAPTPPPLDPFIINN